MQGADDFRINHYSLLMLVDLWSTGNVRPTMTMTLTDSFIFYILLFIKLFFFARVITQVLWPWPRVTPWTSSSLSSLVARGNLHARWLGNAKKQSVGLLPFTQSSRATLAKRNKLLQYVTLTFLGRYVTVYCNVFSQSTNICLCSEKGDGSI